MKFFELFSHRNIEKKTDVYTYDKIPDRFRNQIIHILRGVISPLSRDNDIWIILRDSILKEFGILVLTGNSPQSQIVGFLINGTDVQAIDLIDLIFSELYRYSQNTKKTPYYYYDDELNNFILRIDSSFEEVNFRFKQNQLGYEIIEGELIRVDNQNVHNEIIKPAIKLLFDKDFESAADEFFEAHQHYREGDYEEAIVDAERAFESTMKIICHKKGYEFKNDFSAKKLINVLLENNFIPNYLQNHFSQLLNTLENGLPTVRNKNGSHGQGINAIKIPEYMAKYAINLCATNIVFLVDIYKK